MIYGIGVDIVQVVRFESWERFSSDKLERIFSQQELQYCLENDEKNWQKLAVRFAAKEAFYKAFSQTLQHLFLTHTTMSLLAFCKHVRVETSDWGPTLCVDWDAFEKALGCRLPALKTHVSLSHEKESVIAFVIIEKGE